MATLRERFFERLIREVILRNGRGFIIKGGAAMRSLLGEECLTGTVDLETEWSAIRARVRRGVQPLLEAAGAARP